VPNGYRVVDAGQLGAGFGQSGSRWGKTGGKHTGQDFRVPEGSNVYSPVSGKVERVEDLGNKSYGKYIVVKGDDGREYYFAHLSRQEVGVGDGIAAGTRIGLSGATGNATGPHLHVEVREGGHSVDPLPYLKGHPPVGQQEDRKVAVNGFDADQVKNAQTIIAVGRKMGASDRDIQTALATSMVESELHNVNHGDRDSLGLFQQRPSQGWGTPGQVTDPEYAAGQFYKRLLALPEAARADQGKAAQAVQRSKFPERYGNRLDDASRLFTGASTGATLAGTGGAASGAGGMSGLARATGLDEEALARKYGYTAAWFAQAPELHDLLIEAEANDFTEEEFANRFRGTKWYQTHGAKDREWQSLKQIDPVEAERQQQMREQAIKAQARSQGVTLDPKRLAAMVEDSLRFGWDGSTIQRAVSDEFKYNPKAAGTGKAAATVGDFKELAAQYLVPMSDGRLQDWTRRVLAGETSVDDYKAYVQKQAASLFPDLASEIQSGMTVADYLDPYEQMAAQTLGINPAQVNWLDPKWQQAVFRTDQGTSKRTVMSLADWGKTLRTDKQYGYDKTPEAVRAGTQLASAVAQAFGNQG
jgi:hypothetical protein